MHWQFLKRWVENKENVFLFHKEELQGRVNNVLYVVKEGGFTSYPMI